MTVSRQGSGQDAITASMTAGGRSRRSALRGLVAAVAMAVVTAVTGGQAESQSFPDVDITLVAEVYDSAGWLTLHREVLGTPPNSTKALMLTLPAGTGGNRSLRVDRPKFAVEIVTWHGRSLLKVSVTGKVSAHEALGGLTPFEQAALEVQAGLVQNELMMAYGLTTVPGYLLELYLGRP